MKPKKTKASSEAQKGKSKAKPKGLEIRKETIESLSDEELDSAKGGRAVAHSAACTAECKAAFFSVGCHGK
jgi:hypothetical protein